MNMKLDNKLLTREEAAEFLGVKKNTLAEWACNKRHPLKYVKVGRLAKYKYQDLLDYVDNQTQTIKGGWND